MSIRRATVGWGATGLATLCLVFVVRASAAPEVDYRKAAAQVKQIVGHRGSSADRPENTLAAYRRAIKAGATAIEADVRTTKDGRLITLHDATVDRTTDGEGAISDLTLAQLRKLDAGSWFDAKYRDERIPTMREIYRVARGKIDVLLDLKETGSAYAEAVAREIKKHGEPKRIIVGVRSVEQAKLFRKLLPEARQLGLIPNQEAIEAFAEAGVETIRLWPRWLTDETLVPRVRKAKVGLHLNGGTGAPEEVLGLLRHQPDSLSADDPARLVRTLAQVKKSGARVGGVARAFSYYEAATRERGLQTGPLEDRQAFRKWQSRRRRRFAEKLVYRYEGSPRVVAVGQVSERDGFAQEEFHLNLDGERLFRYFVLAPTSAPGKRLPTIVCFMGHGKVSQLLTEERSYQHAAAARFAQAGYLVYVMENVGMGPEQDKHKDLDRLLRLDGHSWYSLLFAHQRMLLDRVFADRRVDRKRVGVAGVSTGGLLALSAIALEPRLAAASVQGIFGSMRVSFIQDRDRHCGCGAIPGLLPDFDLPDLAVLAAPRPLHISNTRDDTFTPKEARRCVALIRPVYAKLGGPAPLFTSPPGRHEFAVAPALEFFTSVFGERTEAPGRESP